MSVTRFTLAYPSASNAFQNRLRTEFNNKRAAHFEIDLSRPFSRRVSLSLFPPLDLAGNVDGMGLSLFFLFEKLDGPRFRNILRLRLRSIRVRFHFSEIFRRGECFWIGRALGDETIRTCSVMFLFYRGITPSRENDSRMIGVKERS